MGSAAFSGCASSGGSALPESPLSGESPVTEALRGTIRDLPAAVKYAASRSELAVLGRSHDADGAFVYSLISVRDEDATLTVRIPDAPDTDSGANATAKTRGRFRGFVRDYRPDLAIPGAEQTFDMSATLQIGPGSARREHAFLTLLKRRLRELDEGGGIAKAGS